MSNVVIHQDQPILIGFENLLVLKNSLVLTKLEYPINCDTFCIDPDLIEKWNFSKHPFRPIPMGCLNPLGIKYGIYSLSVIYDKLIGDEKKNFDVSWSLQEVLDFLNSL